MIICLISFVVGLHYCNVLYSRSAFFQNTQFIQYEYNCYFLWFCSVVMLIGALLEGFKMKASLPRILVILLKWAIWCQTRIQMPVTVLVLAMVSKRISRVFLEIPRPSNCFQLQQHGSSTAKNETLHYRATKRRRKLEGKLPTSCHTMYA